ncbi:MAG: B12-binding domain-containing radical SAM protein [Calditrichota bacterium]
MNILLLYPEMPETFWSMHPLMRLTGRKSPYPPLGLLTVAALLHETWERKLVDLNVGRLRDSYLEWADLVFISAMNVQQDTARQAIKRCKERGASVVAGGPLFTHQYLEFPEVDYFILNEAEITLPDFIKDWEQGSLKKVYASGEYADLTKSPVPDWNLVDFKHYPYGIVQYSRGCPFLCEFCDVTALFGRKPRLKKAGRIIEELDRIIRCGTPDMILFADDNLIGNKRELKTELLPLLVEWRRRNKYAPGFATQATINLADDEELMQLMLEAGFRHIFIGIETPEAETLAQTGKKQNLNRNMLENVKLLHSKGFIITGGFIIGFDSDSSRIYQRQIDFINQSNIVIATVNRLKAPPGTALYERMKLENRLTGEFSFDEHRSNIKPLEDAASITLGYGKVIGNVLTPAHVYQRAKKFLKEYRVSKVENPICKKNSIRDLMTLFRIIWFIGILSATRLYFIRLVLWTLWNMPKRLDLAFLFSGLMYHFHLLYKRYEKPIRIAATRKGSAPAITPKSRWIANPG